MGFFTSGAFFGVVFVVFLSAIRFSFNIFVRSLFSCLVFLSFLEFIFLSLFWPPSDLGAGGGIPVRLPYFLWLLCSAWG